MKRLVVASVASLALAVFLLAGCTSSSAGSSQGSASAGSGQASSSATEGSYAEKELTLYASKEGAPDKVTVRYYENAPNVPYIGLAHYLSLVFGDDAKVEVADGKAAITTTDGGVAVIDDAANTFTTDSWSKFHNYLEPMQQGKRQGLLDFATPFCRIASLDYDQQTEPLTFDFSKYGIDLHVDSDDAYLPLATASDLMSDVAFNNIVYNGRELCFLDGYDVNADGEKDYSAFYDIGRLSEIMNGLYSEDALPAAA